MIKSAVCAAALLVALAARAEARCPRHCTIHYGHYHRYAPSAHPRRRAAPAHHRRRVTRRPPEDERPEPAPVARCATAPEPLAVVPLYDLPASVVLHPPLPGLAALGGRS